jgi:dTDP-4-amino-4,6-dideoxygalactose transaminase
MISYGQHSINSDDIEAVITVLKSDWLTTGPNVEVFELALEALIATPCFVVSSGTAALHCAYAAIDLEDGDEIITTPMTFIATQATAVLFGAKIIFADVQRDTSNIDPSSVESLITPRTKAIVAVDYAGHPADLDELLAIAKKHNIFLIEDAAHSIGSLYKNRQVGSQADITTFSFFPTKNFTTGEGGALASNNPILLQKAKLFARQGLIRDPKLFKVKNQGPWHQEVHDFGLNYRLPDILCALGISQLGRLSEFKEKRSKIFETYGEAFKDVSSIIPPIKRNYVDPMWHLYSIKVESSRRLEVFEKMRVLGVGCK